MTRDRWRDVLWLTGCGAAVRIALLLLFPAPYGNDSIGRLYFKDELFLSHWLPLAQALVFTVSRVSPDIWVVRVLFALAGSLSTAGFYLFLREVVGRDAARIGGVLFCFNGLYVLLSLMPYQGPLFLGLYYGALALLFRTPHLTSVAGSLLFGLAALTRYEGWFVIPILGGWKLTRELRSTAPGVFLTTASRAVLFFGWGPLVWFGLSFVHWGDWSGFLFQGPGNRFYGWNPHFDLLWVLRYAARMAYWILTFGSPLLLLALWGAGQLLRRRNQTPPSVKLLLWNGLLTLLFFCFVIGREQETVFRFSLFPMSVVLVLAAVGIENLLGRLSSIDRFRVSLPSLIVVGVASVLALAAGIRVYRLTTAPENQAPYQIAQFLEANLTADESALVLASASGDPNEAAPMGYQRIAAISGSNRPRIFSTGLMQESRPEQLRQNVARMRVRYLVRFKSFEPRTAADRLFAPLPERDPEHFERTLETDVAEVFRVHDWPSPL